ncbi:phosphatidylinositol-specific phospholipase C/glycerophosphodiester phosphodiesterase family protein [Robbsia sp. Bb-Pol-6]|uniref:Phosphatidylinositol-specific phospholipase C/glycerophosphodiester phosphodiesterase family protein n=1 Tax=Robbsia betulipollinis TaxID=2981849 RepID=A0ABT3ZNM7_9BURK|nr:phosphatidylinositol-specific phospholipase C/glycerophosphodiester phosphodiesterase family protein [Robbsia betulipollinis]MCY0387558.1 phosphatidylinositol-specific phospholipase C/glycerophosphodiester phosphodiesterase family protein [Robbsia betulipollinis]
MKLIRHRRNTLAELAETDTRYGVEVDIRSQGDRLVMHHDPFAAGEGFDEWIAQYRHGTLILNVKEEGLEARLIALMAAHGIEDYFFLDQSFPFMMRWAEAAKGRCAVRVSEYESIQTALTLAGKVDWVWVDCFTKFPLDEHDAQRLTQAGFRLCLVSPELQGWDADADIPLLRQILQARGIRADAVCTKRPELWELSTGRE